MVRRDMEVTEVIDGTQWIECHSEERHGGDRGY